MIVGVECQERVLLGGFRAYVVRKFPKREKNRFGSESERYLGLFPLQSNQITATDSFLIFRDGLGPYSMNFERFSILARTYHTYGMVMVKTP